MFQQQQTVKSDTSYGMRSHNLPRLPIPNREGAASLHLDWPASSSAAVHHTLSLTHTAGASVGAPSTSAAAFNQLISVSPFAAVMVSPQLLQTINLTHTHTHVSCTPVATLQQSRKIRPSNFKCNALLCQRGSFSPLSLFGFFAVTIYLMPLIFFLLVD